MVNRGVVPLNPNTPVGQMRVRAGDTKYVDLEPPEEGFGDYTLLSDLEIEAFLALSASPTWAIYEAYLQLATTAALESRSIKDYDLAVDTTKRSADLRAIAEMWRKRAEDEDALLGEGDFFDVFPTGSTGEFIPEGTLPIYGRKYTWDRWR